MNRIAYLAAGVETGDRALARMKRTGTTPDGLRVWTPEELDTLRRLYPNYPAIVQATGRSYNGVKAKAQQLGLTPKREHWTGAQRLRLRKLFMGDATRAEIRDAFPTRNVINVYNMARYFGMRRKRKPFVSTGYLAIDLIRQRCFELGLSMIDLDQMAKTGQFFSKGQWFRFGPSPRAIHKAVAALDGQLSVVWNDPDSEATASRPVGATRSRV